VGEDLLDGLDPCDERDNLHLCPTARAGEGDLILLFPRVRFA
jgi:hypothetical protein